MSTAALACPCPACARLVGRLSTPAARNWRRRAAPLLLLAAGLGAYVMLAPTLPHDQAVALDLGDLARHVASVEIAWTRPGSRDDPAVSTRWHFAAGAAPRRLQTKMRVSNGPWVADVDVGWTDTAAAARWSRQVVLTGEPVTLPLHEGLR
jgi:hypothetical protein